MKGTLDAITDELVSENNNEVVKKEIKTNGIANAIIDEKTKTESTQSPVKVEPVTDKSDLKPLLRVSTQSDFVTICQFIGTFGFLVGVSSLSIDTIDDGLSCNADKAKDNPYFTACQQAVEQLIVSLIRRCGVTAKNQDLDKTLRSFFKYRSDDIYSSLTETNFHELSGPLKLQILKFVCLCQFDENSKFKGDFNSQFGPQDLRFQPLGRDFDSSQYWFICDLEKSHRLYRWKYPYTEENWALVSSTFAELQRITDRLRPSEPDHIIKDGKLWEMVNEFKIMKFVPEEKVVKKPKKKKKEELYDKKGSEDVQHRVNRKDIGFRKSLRCVDRKVYTESNPNTDDDDDEDDEERTKFKEIDDKYKKAVDIAKSRKRSKKFLTMANYANHMINSPSSSRSQSPAPLSNNLNNSVKSDPFSFSDTTPGKIFNNCIRKPTVQNTSISKEFIDSLRDLPSISDFKKPDEAEDKCWKCNGVENVDQMLFCDGCDLATYHMDCLEPIIREVPEDDWFCPVCEQVLLYLHLKKNIDKLRVFTYVPHVNYRRKKSVSTPRSNNWTPRHGTPSPHRTPGSQGRTSTYGPRTPSHVSAGLIRPSRPPQYHYVTPRSRTKISKIDRLTEQAQRVYDHSLEEDNVRQHRDRRKITKFQLETSDSESESEIMHPGDVNSAESSEGEFSYRPRPNEPRHNPIQQHANRRPERKYTPDDFLTVKTSSNKPQVMGYNPLGAKRKLMRPSSVSMEQFEFDDDSRKPSLRPAIWTSSPKPYPTGSSVNRENEPLPRSSKSANKTSSKKATCGSRDQPKTMDTATAISEGVPLRPLPRKDDSRSGNVVTETSDLNKSQQEALAAWETMERDRRRCYLD